MATTGTTTTAPLLTRGEVRTINRARDVLARLEDRCTKLGYTRADDDTPEAVRFYAGRIAERCESAADQLFQVLNGLNAYDLLDLSPSQVFNRGDA